MPVFTASGAASRVVACQPMRAADVKISVACRRLENASAFLVRRSGGVADGGEGGQGGGHVEARVRQRRQHGH